MLTYRKTLLILLFITACFSLSFAANPPLRSESWTAPKNLPQYQVTRIVDGDTIEVAGLGKIRYIGVNTPELHHPTKGVEPFGREATLVNRQLVLGKMIRLEYDVAKHDKYGRILAYVYAGSTFVNAYLVETGYAQIMTIPPNVKYAKLFLELQQKARTNNCGLWGNPVTAPLKTGKYLASLKGKKFHYPNCQWAKEIKAENQLWFASRQAALTKGYQPCNTCKP